VEKLERLGMAKRRWKKS